jgi:hypothetical protein
MHPGLFETRSRGWRLSVAETALKAPDPENMAQLVLRERRPLELVFVVPWDAVLQVPVGRGRESRHPWAGATIRVRLDLLVDAFRRVSCCYPDLCPLAWIPEPVPVHLAVRQAAPDKGSLCLEQAFERAGGWNKNNTLVHIAWMCHQVLLGSAKPVSTVSGLALDAAKLPALLRLMEASAAPLRPNWKRRRLVVLWFTCAANS